MTIQQKILLNLMQRNILHRREVRWLVMAERHHRQVFSGQRNDELTIPKRVNKSFKLMFLLTVLRLLIEEPFFTTVGFAATPIAIYVFVLTTCKWLYQLFV